jgi:hypothetical protein
MYNTWHHDVLYFLCEQEERAKLVGEVESAQADKRNLEYQLGIYLEKMDALDQKNKKELSYNQVNQSASCSLMVKI